MYNCASKRAICYRFFPSHVHVFQTSEGFTALHLASYQGAVSLMELLIMNGANPDVKDVDRRLPLHWSTHPGSTKPIDLLFKVTMRLCH